MTATATVEAPPASGKRRLLLIGVVLLLLVGGGAAFMFLGGEAGAEVEEEAPVEGAIVPIAEMTASLAGPQVHFAKLSLAAVLSDQADAALVEERMPLLKDAAITELSTMDAAHLRTTEGMEELRTRLTERATGIYVEGEVLRVILTELIVQ